MRIYAIFGKNTIGYIGFASPSLRKQAIDHCKELGIDAVSVKSTEVKKAYQQHQIRTRYFNNFHEFKMAIEVVENNFYKSDHITSAVLIERIENVTADFSTQMRLRKVLGISKEYPIRSNS